MHALIKTASQFLQCSYLWKSKWHGLDLEVPPYFVPAPELFHLRPIIIALPRPRSRLTALQKWHWHCFLDKVDTEMMTIDQNLFPLGFELRFSLWFLLGTNFNFPNCIEFINIPHQIPKKILEWHLRFFCRQIHQCARIGGGEGEKGLLVQ